MTWITDSNGTYWVEPVPRKKRRPARALRFQDLVAGDVLIHRGKFKREVTEPASANLKAANTNSRTEQGVVIGLALCEFRWFDPVRGERDPIAGELAGIRSVGPSGPVGSLYPHTLRGLAQQGYWPTGEEQADAIREWLAQIERLTACVTEGSMTRAEARAQYKSRAALFREIGVDFDGE